MSVETMKASLRQIPDYPIKGILFWDITTLMKDAKCLRELEDTLYDIYKDRGITKVVGLESRGFIMGPALAARLGAGFVMARKLGKLPSESIRERYDKEYGHDTIEIHIDAISPDDVVLVHDDLLATGGTMAAALRLVKKFGVRDENVMASFIIEIDDLKGRDSFGNIRVDSVIHV